MDAPVKDGHKVSVILPVKDAQQWLEETLDSVASQTFEGSLQISIYDDASVDGSMAAIGEWMQRLPPEKAINVVIGCNTSGKAKGVGFARNRAIEQSDGQYLCFLDADDVMEPDRIRDQLEVASKEECLLVGSCLHREPEGSTKRFIEWANGLTREQLETQIYTSHGPTVLMPTWFCSRRVAQRVGGFDEGGKGVPEDLLFFFKHLDFGGKVAKVDKDLLMYRYHESQTTFSIDEKTIWLIRLVRLQAKVLIGWPSFTIWNAGKVGRRFYRSLAPENRAKVAAFCDVDENKISKGVYVFEESDQVLKPRVPVVHFRNARPPFIICVKQGLTSGHFEANLTALNLSEGVDYIHFG